jgi:hypothetical protein
MHRKTLFLATAAMAIATAGILLASCGGSDSPPPAQSNVLVASTPSYRVEYDPGTSTASIGKTTFRIMVTPSAGGNPVGGAAIALMPIMHMASMNHTTPVDTGITESPAGTYHCTVYFLMASMGTEYWELQVGVNGETATFQPPVGMAMGSDTVRVNLKGQNDNIAVMGMGSEQRTFYVFRDKFSGMPGNHTFGIFLAAKESMMDMPALVAGETLHDQMNAAWTVNAIAVSASSDNGATWVNGSNTGGAHWEFPNLAGLASGTAGHVRVRLFVNGEQKTTDGGAPSGTNEYADFTVTPM